MGNSLRNFSGSGTFGFRIGGPQVSRGHFITADRGAAIKQIERLQWLKNARAQIRKCQR